MIWNCLFGPNIMAFFIVKAVVYRGYPMVIEGPIVRLIIIVNIIFSEYFKHYFTYDYFLFTVRSPCQTAWPVPTSPSYILSLFSQIVRQTIVVDCQLLSEKSARPLRF